jgi:hypothetical protein
MKKQKKDELMMLIDDYHNSCEWLTNPMVPKDVKVFAKETKQLLNSIWDNYIAHECGLARKFGMDELDYISREGELDKMHLIETFSFFLEGFVEGYNEAVEEEEKELKKRKKNMLQKHFIDSLG